MRRAVLSLLGLGMMAAPLAAQAPSPYTAAAHHEIKSVAPDEMADLRAGRGMGLAKPAELNGYPGPMHVLELAAPLDLSAAQRDATTEILHSMRAAALPLGEQIIAAERALDRAFAEARIDPAGLRAATREIALLRGNLRAIHLDAHLQQRALLTAEQTHRYMALRGYADAPRAPHHRR